MLKDQKQYKGGRRGDNGNKYYRPSLEDHEKDKKKGYILSSVITLASLGILVILISVVSGVDIEFSPTTGKLVTTHGDAGSSDAINSNSNRIEEHIDDFEDYKELLNERNENLKHQVEAVKESLDEFKSYQREQNEKILDAIKNVDKQ